MERTAAVANQARTVLVDLIHDHPAILQGNLVAAKYLQRVLGCSITAVIADWSRVYYNYSREANIALAASYGVTDILDLDASAPADVRVPDFAPHGIPSQLLQWV